MNQPNVDGDEMNTTNEDFEQFVRRIEGDAAQNPSPATTESQATSKLDADSCGQCYVKSKVTNPGIAGGHIENDIVYCPLHAAAPALYAALKAAKGRIETLGERLHAPCGCAYCKVVEVLALTDSQVTSDESGSVQDSGA